MSITTSNSALGRIVYTPSGAATRQLSKKPIVFRAEHCTAKAVFGKREVTMVTSVITALQTLPAFAIVDDRLNGDGTGLPLGINDGALGIVLGSIPLGIFALYYIAGKQESSIVAGGKNDDSGLSL
jgi:photosystem II PsbW protein